MLNRPDWGCSIKTENLEPAAMAVFCELWQVEEADLGIPGRPQPDENIPSWLMTSRQALRLAKDIDAVGDGDCNPIDVCRIFTFSSRQDDFVHTEESRRSVWHTKVKGVDTYRKLLADHREAEDIDSTSLDTHLHHRLCTAGGAFGAIDPKWKVGHAHADKLLPVPIGNPVKVRGGTAGAGHWH